MCRCALDWMTCPVPSVSVPFHSHVVDAQSYFFPRYLSLGNSPELPAVVLGYRSQAGRVGNWWRQRGCTGTAHCLELAGSPAGQTPTAQSQGFGPMVNAGCISVQESGGFWMHGLLGAGVSMYGLWLWISKLGRLLLL